MLGANFLPLLLALFLTSVGQCQQDSWRFINIPDYHKAEGLSIQIDAERQKRIEEQRKEFLAMYNQYGGDLITIPGDIVGGHWYRKNYLKKFRSQPEYTNYSTTDVILESCDRSYRGLREIIFDAGYKNLLIAVGDHEIGDNPWQLGTKVVEHITTFREGFAKVFTKNEDGSSRFTKKIGNALARPVGTPYEHTSNAFQHKNVLFITIDMFRFDGADIKLGGQGVVSGDISGKHLEWLENVLYQAQSIPTINHIVVQSHLPIIYPVRKHGSSGMLVNKTQREKILTVFRKYNVDLYLGGEVHMNTVTKDPKSNLIQFVGRGNDLSNITTIDVEKERLLLNTYHKNGTKLGSLIIDKSNNKTHFDSDGLLKPIDPNGMQIHWSFDSVLSKSDYHNSVDGGFPKKAKQNKLLESLSNAKAFLNDGDFNYDYSLISDNVSVTPGVIGNAVLIDKDTKLFVVHMGPLESDYKRTISCWINTAQQGRQLLFNSGSFWSKNGQFFNISINNGDLEIATRPDTFKKTVSTNLNDGKWHHLAVVLPKEKGEIKDLLLFVDGQLIAKTDSQNPSKRISTAQSNWMSIATHIPAYKTNVLSQMKMVNYRGLLDDFCIWTRELSTSEIKEIYTKGLQGISALEIEKNKILLQEKM